MLERLACKSGRNDENLNIELAEYLCKEENASYVKEIVDGVMGNDTAIANDCIKVLYEIGERKPELIKAYAEEFLTLLSSKNNRLVWGGMTALASIASLQAKEIYESLPRLMKAYEKGSVITVDQSISVFAKLCKADKEYEKELYPFLLKHLRSCRPKEAAQHAERMSICVNQENSKEFIQVLEERKPHMTEAQIKRVEKLIKGLKI